MDENTTKIKSIFRHLAVRDIPRVLIISKGLRRINLLTSKFSGRSDHTEILLLDTFHLSNSSFEFKNNLFPDKIKNLQGKELVLAIFNYKPYTVWTEVTTVNANSNVGSAKKLFIDGTESLVFLEFCKKFNCTLEISLDEEGEWGEIFENRTGNGIIGATVERRADIGVGALYSWYHEFNFLSLSKPISRTGITCIVPKPRPLASWHTPILPFSVHMWIAVTISYFVTMVSLRLLSFATNHLRNNNQENRQSICESSMVIGSIYVLQSVSLRNQTVSQMLFVSCLLFTGLMLGNAYSGGMASVMTIPQYEVPIDTVQQLAERNLHWGSTHDAWIFSIQLATQPVIVKLLSNFRTYSKEILQAKTKMRNLAYSIERLPFGHYAIGDYITEEASNNFHIMLEDIYWENCVAMSTKTWPMMEELDDLILRIAQSGIQRYWELKVVMKYTDNKVQLAVAQSRHRDNIGPTVLKPTHLIGAFILLAFGLALSAIAFIAELIWWHR